MICTFLETKRPFYDNNLHQISYPHLPCKKWIFQLLSPNNDLTTCPEGHKGNQRFEGIYPPRIRLNTCMKSTDFVVRKLLNTTNAVRLNIVMFSWHPLLSLLIFRFFNTRALLDSWFFHLYGLITTLLQLHIYIIIQLL